MRFSGYDHAVNSSSSDERKNNWATRPKKENHVGKKEVLVTLDVMSNRHGHKPEVITVDDDPERRKELAEHVKNMIKGGFIVQLDDGTKVLGYDAKTNSWLVAAEGKKKTAQVSAQGRTATATPLTAGG